MPHPILSTPQPTSRARSRRRKRLHCREGGETGVDHHHRRVRGRATDPATPRRRRSPRRRTAEEVAAAVEELAAATAWGLAWVEAHPWVRPTPEPSLPVFRGPLPPRLNAVLARRACAAAARPSRRQRARAPRRTARRTRTTATADPAPSDPDPRLWARSEPPRPVCDELHVEALAGDYQGDDASATRPTSRGQS
jgi:hypothetical protein